MLKENLDSVRKQIKKAAEKSGRAAEDVLLVAVTKTYPAEMINEAIKFGVTDIGENKVQEILDKYDSVLPVNWHLIGHLQTNKVKYIIDKVKMIHSVDSIKLMDEIERQAEKNNINSIDILIQLNISGEESKFGIEPNEIEDIFIHCESLKRIKIRGLMTVLPKCCDSITRKLFFDDINSIFVDNKSKTYHNISMEYLSMGMSGDFCEAIECGSNIVRIGSKIFGERDYSTN